MTWFLLQLRAFNVARRIQALAGRDPTAPARHLGPHCGRSPRPPTLAADDDLHAADDDLHAADAPGLGDASTWPVRSHTSVRSTRWCAAEGYESSAPSQYQQAAGWGWHWDGE